MYSIVTVFSGSLLSATSSNSSPHSLHSTGPYPSRRLNVLQTGHGPLLNPFISESSAITRQGQSLLFRPTQGIAADVGSPPDPTQRNTSYRLPNWSTLGRRIHTGQGVIISTRRAFGCRGKSYGLI